MAAQQRPPEASTSKHMTNGRRPSQSTPLPAGSLSQRRGSTTMALGDPATTLQPAQAHPFPTLPPQQLHPGQERQSDEQMKSILTMPPVLLAQLARTGERTEQVRVVERMHAGAYLDAMTLPPPSPAEDKWAGTGPELTHEGMPLLLQQVFSPQTSGIIAQAPEVTPGFQLFASSEEWARKEAERRGYLDPDQLSEVSSQLESWAFDNLDNDVHHTVYHVKGTAVDLAAKAAAQSQALAQNQSPRSAGRTPRPRPEIDVYAQHYRDELNALASGYYSKLHREALATLTQNPTTSSSEPEAIYVRAAAVAALTANVMAADHMAKSAEETLTSMGVDVSAVLSPAPVIPTHAASLPLPPNAQTTPLSIGTPATSTQISSPPGASLPTTVATLVQQATMENRCSPEHRDYLLTYAHQTYSTHPDDPSLLPLLNMLNRLHPGHSPTMLLLSCVYYSKGVGKKSEEDLQASIYWNSEILKVDGDYVEAMSNIGTTLRALGKSEDAERWWWQALERRPTYFDAFDNLLGVLCNPKASRGGQGQPRYEQAIRLCDFVEAAIYRLPGDPPDFAMRRPVGVPPAVPISHIHRLQNLYYAKGNLYLARGDLRKAKTEYEKGIEPLLSGLDGTGLYTLKDLLIAGTLVGLELMHRASAGVMPSPIQKFQLHGTDWLAMAHAQSDRLGPELLQMGGGFFPIVLLTPQSVATYALAVFDGTGQRLPALARGGVTGESANQTTSTILLTLAKLFQDASASPSSSLAQDLLRSGLPASPAIILPLYYFSIALHPSPSTFNNLGILLSSIPSVTPIFDPNTGQHMQMTGQALAMQFYQAGLQRDAKHPHLYTNLGSLLKDSGQLQQAVQMYQKAVECNPNFDVALANLGNALKDMGHVQESVQWYKRAVELNPAFPEAVCGLVNALGGVCDWRGRGAMPNELGVDQTGALLLPAADGKAVDGWMPQIAAMVQRQLDEGSTYGRGSMASVGDVEAWIGVISVALTGAGPDALNPVQADKWRARLAPFVGPHAVDQTLPTRNEGGFAIRLIERLMRRAQRRWYIDAYGPVVAAATTVQRAPVTDADRKRYQRTPLPPTLPLPAVPTVLPFHTFTYPLGARATRLISHRNALRISHTTLSQPWLPPHVYPPPAPPQPRLRVGYVSSDFNNHPLAHLMQSVFGLHDRTRFSIFCYATTPSDRSPYRVKIEREAEHFVDVSAWSNQQVVERIVADGIHVLCNLNGYTKGARNEIFAARPSPVTMQFMGFAGTMAAGWNDWVLSDPLVCPPDTIASEVWRARREAGALENSTDLDADLDPEEASEDWVYTERFCFMPSTYFCTDHKQSFDDKPTAQAVPTPAGTLAPVPIIDPEVTWRHEESRRWAARRELFPQLTEDSIIFCCMNQLYKIDPVVFRIWLDILKQLPNAVLWLLRFPAAGEPHLKRTAAQWAGEEVASRVLFTDVASKSVHIERGRVADLFLDATECSAHTTCADILWAGTPIVTWPRHRSKFCSRVAASIVSSTGFADQMVVSSAEEYVARAVALARSVSFTVDPSVTPPMRRGQGELYDLRKKLFLSRESQELFDTAAWTRNVERGYLEAWRRWVAGTEFEDSPEWAACDGPEKRSSCIYLGAAPS